MVYLMYYIFRVGEPRLTYYHIQGEEEIVPLRGIFKSYDQRRAFVNPPTLVG